MKTVAQLSEDCLKSGLFILLVEITNDDAEECAFPLEQLRANTELSALRIRTADGELVEPVEYMLVNPSEAPAEHVLAPGNSVQFELAGDIEEKAPGVFALTFPRATYRLLRNGQYSVAISWGNVVVCQPVAFCL